MKVEEKKSCKDWRFYSKEKWLQQKMEMLKVHVAYVHMTTL